MTRARRLPLLLAATALLAAVAASLPASAGAALRASTKIETRSGVTRLVVALSSTTPVTARARPRSVTVRSGRRTYVLSRVRRSAAASRGGVSLGTWRSAAFRGRTAAAVRALAGRRVTVRVGTRVGVRSLTTTARLAPTPRRPRTPTAPTTPTTPTTPTAPGGPAPRFAPPGRELTGNEAFEAIRGYFANSRFTDCPGAGWPSCAVEERYCHFADGSFEYHRFTPSSGSDINTFGFFQVTGAVQHADGSWGIEYQHFLSQGSTPSFYSWDVAANGTVVGRYWEPGSAPPAPPSQNLGPLTYQQPASTNGAGNCGL